MKTTRERVLLVEFDPEISDLIARQTLQAVGYQVQIVHSASAALQEISRYSPDVILTNLNLPDLSGKDLLVALASQSMDAPVIVIAHQGMESDLIQAFRLGAADYLLWPTREAEVVSAVERVFKQVRSRRERETLARQLKQTNNELQQRVRELTTIFAIGKAVTSITKQSDLFEKIVEGAVYVTEADCGWLLLREVRSKTFNLAAQRNLPKTIALKINHPWDDGISSLVALSGETLSISGEPLARFKVSQLGQSALVVPVKLKKEVVGLLVVVRKAPNPFSPSNKTLLEAVADYASISLVNASLFRALEERAHSMQHAAEAALASDIAMLWGETAITQTCMPSIHILLILSNPETAQQLEKNVLAPAEFRVTQLTEWKTAGDLIRNDPPDLVIVNDNFRGQDPLQVATDLARSNPLIPILLLPETHSDELALAAFRLGFAGYIKPTSQISEIMETIHLALERRQQWEDYARLLASRDIKSLQKKIGGLETIVRIGSKVTSVLDLDGVLTNIVDAAVDISGAEEGSLLLLDENSGELYIRASRNFQEDFVKTFRLSIRDSLVGQVLLTGKPLLVHEKTPQKIKTAYLVYSIIYVPISLKKRVVGVLEIDNRESEKTFTDYHVTLLTALADYATIALENTQLYAESESEREKLETILTGIEDGVIVVDSDRRLILMNRKAREAFEVTDENLTGKRVRDIIQHQELVDFIRGVNFSSPSRMELNLKDGRVMNTQITPIPEIGLVVTMQDITYLKELDRIKTDFVNTISHDLRSPLTAILGYVELIERVGQVTPQQKEFIRRVQLNVQSITALINDLLDLGRIEAGFDTQKEVVQISTIISYAIDGLRNRASEKSQELIVDVPELLQPVLGNPVRLRQMVTHLLINAINYSGESARINLTAQAEAGQVILQIKDSGPGIPPADLPYIFDKFYRASNTPSEIPGSGLGLAIVKSIIDDHLGRIWVDSTLGQGTTFTIVLPIINQDL
jgi:two-component system NtrC family sensor kinase